MRRVCVFCGSSSGRLPAYVAAARAFGEVAAARGLGVVFGGGHVGLMGALADAALAAGGEVLGVIPQGLVDRELAHGGLTELHVVSSLHERKALMAELSDAFVALPGGFGTLDELMEQLTWSQLGLHAKPVGLYDVDDYWRPLIAFARHATVEGFVRESDLGAIAVAGDAAGLLDRLERMTREERPRPKWSSPDPERP
ncbi:MAG: TIGR00730 family Rossman fold protein [Gaiellaceae bacterium]